MPLPSRFVARMGCITALLLGCSCEDPKSPPDTTAPAAITDLAVSATTLQSVTLSWTAPGDDGLAGRVAHYLVRYAATGADAFAWDAATPAAEAAIPVPDAAGTRQECTIVGLAAYRLAHFAVRAADNAGNLSPLSNRIAAAAENPVAQDELDVVGKLSLAYQQLDPGRFDSLLHPDYQFRLNEPTEDGTVFWGAAEELRIHHRMFRPADIPAGQPPVALELWLRSIDLTMIPSTSFQPRPQYYADPLHNPAGLDPSRWEVRGADYSATVFFETQGGTDYRVEGRAEFVIANDLAKGAGDPGKFLLYRWADLGRFGFTSAASWSQIKNLYR